MSDEHESPVEVRLLRVRVELLTAHEAAHGTETTREVVLVRWTGRDGVHGWGECPTLAGPGYVTEPTDVAWRALVDVLAPAEVGLVSRAPDGLTDGLLAAPAALADARLDARLRRLGTSLRTHLGGTRTTLARCHVLADLHSDPDRLAARAVHAVEQGAAMVKLKVAPGVDLAGVRATVQALGAGRVAADCNGVHRHPSEVAELDELGLRYIEQPFDPTLPWPRLASMAAHLATPVALDESLTSVEATHRAIDAGAVSVVSAKPARMGGVAAAAEAVRLAGSAGLDAFVGGMLELGVGRAGAAAVASLPECTLPTDLGPSGQYVERDVCEPVVLDAHGWLAVPEGDGIGREPDEAYLAGRVVEEVTLHAAR